MYFEFDADCSLKNISNEEITRYDLVAIQAGSRNIASCQKTGVQFEEVDRNGTQIWVKKNDYFDMCTYIKD